MATRDWAVLYDADCGFCKWLLAILLRWDRAARLHPIALQRPEADELLADLELAARMRSWHLISPGGERRSGGDAIPPLLTLLPGGRLPAAAFARFPGLTDRGYRWVAEHRSQLSRLVPRRVKQHASVRVHRREQGRKVGYPAREKGSVDREAGERPARTRHCDRARSPAHAMRQPLATQAGKARREGSEVRRPTSDP